MKILKAVFFNLMVLCSISFVSADAHYDSSIGIIINGSGNNLSSIETNIGNPVVFSYINTTGTAMVNTNIFVDENSELILNNQTLVFNCSYVGECRLETNSNGTHEMGGNSTLMVVNRSRLTVSNPGYEFYMVVRNNSAFTLRDSELTECGFNISHPGLNITAKYANITDNVIYDVYYGIYLNHADYCSISGNNISSEKDGIQLNYADYCSISGNNISSESYKGIYLENSDYCSISGNNVSAYNEGIHMQYSDYCDILMNRISSVQSGIYLYSSDNNNISNSMVFSSDFRGFYLVSSNYCNISENNISSDDEGIYLSSSNNNTLSDSQVVSSNSHGVYLINSDYVTLISSHLLGTVKDLKLESSSENLRLINTTYSSSEIVDSSSYLRRFWYLDVYVKDSAGNPIHGVNVTGWMLNGTQAFTTLTASTGYIARQTVEQYYQNYTNISYYTPHMVNVSKGDYLPENKNFSLSVSKFLLFELNTPPERDTDQRGRRILR
jgi:parallel beta-helix repeat protein